MSTDTLDFTLPNAIESEIAYLSASLNDPAQFADTKHLLTPSDFCLPRNQMLFEAMLDLAVQDAPINDIDLVCRHLANTGKLAQVGRDYIVMLATQRAVNAEHHARIVLDKSQRRQLLVYAESIRTSAADASQDVNQLMTGYEEGLLKIVERGVSDSASVSFGDALDRQWQEIEAVTNGHEVPGRTPSRHPEGRSILRGYLNASVYTIAARPGVGKSSMAHTEAISIARHCLQRGQGERVVIYSLEMPENQVTNGITAQEALIPYTALDDRMLSGQQLKALMEATPDLSRLPIDIVDDMFCYEDIEADIRKRWRRGTLGTVFVDQLGLLETRAIFNGDSADRQRINYIMPKFKRLAMKVKRPLFMLHQVNREGDGEPRLKHLKDSGKVEESSDAVLFLHRDMEAAETLDANAMQNTAVIVAKNRHGRVGRFTIAFHGMYKAFVSPATPRQMATQKPSKNGHNHWSDDK